MKSVSILAAMPYAPHTAAIAHRLAKFLSTGMDLPPAALRFIDSTFADPSAAGLSAIFDAESDSEQESLLELLLTPDDSVHLDLEELLIELGSVETNPDEIIERLSRSPLSVEFRLPKNRGAILVFMTPERIRRFLRPLHIDRSIPTMLAAAVEAHLKPRERLRLRVMLRGARFEFSPSVNDFLGRLIEGLDWGDPTSWEAFAFALEILAGLDPNADIGHTLVEWKRRLLHALEHAQQQRKQLASANVEMLMSRGQRLTCVDESAVRRQVGHIDRIHLAAFRRIIHFGLTPSQEALTFSEASDIAELIRRLA
jgi:hypothetical protein